MNADEIFTYSAAIRMIGLIGRNVSFMMVCCKLMERHAGYAIYAYGSSSNAMYGRFMITTELNFRLFTPIEHEKYLLLPLRKLLVKYRNDFANGVFEDYIAYQAS